VTRQKTEGRDRRRRRGRKRGEAGSGTSLGGKGGMSNSLINDTVMDFFEYVMLPICICVVLPVLIVLIVGLVRKNETNRKAEIMLKAIENGVTIDPELFMAKTKKRGSIKQDLMDKLTGACITSLMGVAFIVLALVNAYAGGISFNIFPSSYVPVAGAVLLAVGIGLFISYFVSKKMLAKEIEAEERELLEK
jgi:hypothetical protein